MAYLSEKTKKRSYNQTVKTDYLKRTIIILTEHFPAATVDVKR